MIEAEALAHGETQPVHRDSKRQKRPTVPMGKKRQVPRNQNDEKLPSLPNIEWTQRGVGWTCRESYYVGKQRRRRHIGYLGRGEYEQMAARGNLETELANWIEERKFEKGLAELGGEAEQRPLM